MGVKRFCCAEELFQPSFQCCSTHTRSIYLSCSLHIAILRVAGRDFTEHLIKIFTERGCPFVDVKDNSCCIGLHSDTNLKSTAEFGKEATNKIPDGNVITVDAIRSCCVEVLFRPSFLQEASGFTTLLSYFTMCDVENRKELYANVALSVARPCFMSA